MKTLIKIVLMIAIVFGTHYCFAQKIEIVVVGSSHENPKGSENFDQIIAKLKAFNPEMVFGEYLSPADYKALPTDNWAYEAFKRGRDFISHHHPEKARNLNAKIASAIRALNKFAYFHKLRMDLAIDYIQQGDRGNAEYQLFMIENYMKKSFGKEELAYYAHCFYSPDSLKKAGIYRPESEYSTIYFPLIYQLKQDRIYAMDCQKYDKPWSEAWGIADSLIKDIKKKALLDSTSVEGKLMAEIDKYASFTAEDKKIMSNSSYTNMATPRFGELIDAWNFYGGSHFFGHEGFPTEKIKDMYTQWYLRNEGMCVNVLKQAREKHAKRVVIGVGAGHRKVMEDMLAKDPDVNIISYNKL